MNKRTFTKDDVIAAAQARYSSPISIDTLEDAMNEETLEDAVEIILLDSCMWDSPSGDPFDTDFYRNLSPQSL